MSADKVRKLLGSLQDNPESENAWIALEERAINGELAGLGSDLRAWLEQMRKRFIEQGEAEAAARLINIESVISTEVSERSARLRERARILEEDLLDDKAAMAALEAILALGPDPEAAESRERIGAKKSRWKDILEVFKNQVENDSSDPALIASHLTSAAGIVLQYKGKGKDRESDAIFQQALEVDPGNLRAIQLYERSLRRRGNRWDDLASHLERGADQVAGAEPKVRLLFRAARTHAAHRSDIAAAERVYRRVLDFDPGNPDATRFLVSIFQDRDRWDELAAFYDQQSRLMADPAERVGLLVQAGMTHWRMRNDPASARPFFARISELVPGHQTAQNFFAENSNDERLTEPEVAISTGAEEVVSLPHEEASESSPAVADDSQPTRVYIYPTVELQNAIEAVQTVGQPAAEAAQQPRAVARPTAAQQSRVAQALEAAQVAEAAGHTDRAIEQWKLVVRQDATHADARAALGRLFRSAERWNNLVDHLRQELDGLGGTRPGPEQMSHRDRKLEILREMVAIYRDRMALEPMVVQQYNAILALEPGDRASLVALAESYEKLGRYPDVIKTLDQQAEHTEDASEKVALLRRIALIWLERFKNANNATRPLEQIVAIDPRNADAITQLKDLYGKRRVWRPLFDVSRRELELLSGDKRRNAVVELAKLAAEKLGSPTESIALWREALALDRTTPGALDALEKLTEREKDYAGLAEVLERRVEETADAELRVNVLMKLGGVYGERLGDSPRSIDAWRRVLATRPGHPKALRVLRDAYTQTSQWDVLEELYASTGDFEGLADVLGGAADRATEPGVKVALSFRAARVYEEKLSAPERAFRSYERVLQADAQNLRAALALVPIYLKDEKWSRLAHLYEVLLDSLGPDDLTGSLDYLHKLRELSSGRLGDRAAAFRWALRAYRLVPTDGQLELTLERCAADAGTWRELVVTFDARASESRDREERGRLRDKSAVIEADRLNQVAAAIGRYQSALADSPEDSHLTLTLDRLLRRAQRWTDLRGLYDHRLARGAQGPERRALLDEVAKLEEGELRDPDGASVRYRAILDEDPSDRDALASLSRLAEASGRWKELGGLLSRRRDAALGEERAELGFKLGTLRVERLGDPQGAIESFREVLSLVGHHAGALSSLEALLRDEAWRVQVATILEPEFEAIGEHRKLAWVLQILLDTSGDSSARRVLALRLSKVYGERLEDPRSGFELVRGVLDQQPESGELADALSEMAAQGGWNDELAAALSKIVDRSGLPGEVRVELARRTAGVYEDRHANPAAAERFHRIVLDAGLLDAHAFGALKRLYHERERWSDLRGLYATWVERTPDPGAKVELLLEEAMVLEEMLDQPSEAAGVYYRIRELDEGNRTANRALDRLLIRLLRWADLATLLTETSEHVGAGAPEEVRELTFRRGEVRELHLGDSAAALEDYRRVVSEDPAHAGARSGLERLLALPALRIAAGAVLEPLYAGDNDPGAANLVRMLLVRLEGTEDSRARSELYRRVAELREIVLNDTPGAFAAMEEASLAEPSSEMLRAELLRLSAMAGTDAGAAEALERAAVDPRALGSRVAILRDLAGIYDERLVDHGKAERTYRRMLEVAEDDTEVVTLAAVALERLYRGLSNARGLVEALGLRAKHEPDAELRRSLYAQSAEILEDELGDLKGAIAAQNARLSIDASDRAALGALARLHEKTGAWTALVATLQQDASLCGDGAEQKGLLLRAARVLEGSLADVTGAIGLYSEVLVTYGPDREVHAALARLYEVSDQWDELLEVVEMDLAQATESADRLGLIVRAAELRRLRTRDFARAVEGYKEALELEASQPAARAALAVMLGSGEPGVPLAAARALDPVLQAEQAWEKLVEVLDRIAADTDDPEERRRVLARASEVCEIGMNEPGRAFEYAAAELQESLLEADVGGRLEAVERLATISARQRDLVTVLRKVAPELLDPVIQLGVFMKVAGLSSTALHDQPTARRYYELALEQRGDYLPALDALEALHELGGAYGELLDVLKRKTELATSDEARKGLLRKQAKISEEKLSNRPAAALAHESILAIGFDREAALGLERIYAAESRWEDLALLLESQLGIEDADVVDLYFRLGAVSMQHIGDYDRALDHFREVLDRNPSHGPTVLALEALGSKAEYLPRTATMLEPIYRARMDVPKLIGALEARIAAETDVVARKELLSSLGLLYEDNLGEFDKALETYARVFREEITDKTTWEVLSRLARSLKRFDRLAAIYAEALREVASDDEVTAELGFQTAKLFDEHVADTVMARVFYRRALAFDPGRIEVFSALEALLLRERVWPELLGLYRDAADRVGEVEARKGYLFKIADIDEKSIGDLAVAIEDFRLILETDPADGQAIERLDGLLVRTSAWQELAELLDRRISDAIDSEERGALRFRLGRLRADALGDARGAMEAFREILDERRDHRQAIAALEQIADTNPSLRLTIVEVLEPLYRELDDWPKLIVVLNVRLGASEDTTQRGQLLREVGDLKERRAKDIRGAYAAFSQAFAADSGDGEAREAVERLALSHGLWEDLVRTYEAAAAATDDAVVKVDLLRAIAQTHDQRRDDPRAAIDAYDRLFALDDSQVEVLDLLEMLHVLLSDWAGHVTVLERKVERSLDDEQRKALLHTIGESQRDMLGNGDAAVSAYVRALEFDSGDVVALEALDGLYAGRGDARSLARVLQQRLDIEADPEARRETALRLGKLWETELDDLALATEAYGRALDDAPVDPEAIHALERLYASRGMHPELLENLRKQVSLAEDEASRAPLRLRIGALLAGELAEPDAALEAYREVLDGDAANTTAIAALRALALNVDQRSAAVGVLEPIFRDAKRWDDLVATLELKLTVTDDPAGRLSELRALAEVHGSGRQDPGKAFDSYCRALHEDPADRETLSDLERLSAELTRWADLATLLETESRATSDPTVSRDLSVRAAQIATGKLADDARATKSYCHALEQGGDDDAVLAPLDEIHSRASQWRELAEVLERRAAVATEASVLDTLEVRIASLREIRFEDPQGALRALRNVVDRSPTHGEALAGLERLIAVASVKAEAMEVLEACFQRNDDSGKLAWLMGLRVQGADHDGERVRLLGELARLLEDRLGDLSGAFDATVRAFRIDPREESVVSEIERLAPVGQLWERLRGIVESTLEQHTELAAEDVAQLNLRAARWYRDAMNDPGSSEQRLLAVLRADPESLEGVEMLEGLHRAQGRERDLVATLRRRAELEMDVEGRKAMLREAAQIAEGALSDVESAASLTVLLLDVDDSDLSSLEALSRLRKVQGRNEEVADLLSRRARLADDPREVVALRREVAELYAGAINDPERAIMAYRDLLDFDPNEAGARGALEKIYEGHEKWRDLEGALRSRLDVSVTAEERASTRMRLAALREGRFQDVSGAVEVLREVIDELPTHASAGSELERIYTREERWAELSELLERRAEDQGTAGDAEGELSTLVRMGELNERELRNAARAVDLFDRVLARDPQHVAALGALARLHESDGNWERAIEMLGRALALASPGREGARMALHLARMESERMQREPEAESALRRALALDEASLEAIEALKAMATRRGDHVMLIEVMERELRVLSDPKQRVALLRVLSQLARERLADPVRAAGYLEQALALTPEDRELLLPLVELYGVSGREHDAVPILEKIVQSFGARRSKELAQWQHRLGRVHEALGDLPAALSSYDSAFKVDLTSVPILRDLGLLCLKTSDLERAQKTFRALLLQRLDGTSGITKADVYFYLGSTLEQQGDKLKATSMLERALEADKTHARAAELLGRLKSPETESSKA